jgi:hypothetical protein
MIYYRKTLSSSGPKLTAVHCSLGNFSPDLISPVEIK